MDATLDQVTFLGKFCNDGCSQTTLTALQPYVQCIDGGVAALYAATIECAKRPQCYTGTTYSALQDFNNCLTPLTNAADATAAAAAAVSGVCAASTTCTAKLSSFVTQHPDCLPPGITFSATDVVAYFNFMCSTPAGSTERCAWNLRRYASIWQTSAGAETTARQSGPVLDLLCTPCFDGHITYAARVGLDPMQLSATRALLCSRPSPTSSSYCWNTADLPTIFSYWPMSVNLVAAACTGDIGTCPSRLLNAYAELTFANGAANLKSCAANPSSLTAFYSKCQVPYETFWWNAEYLRLGAQIFCATNRDSNLCYLQANATRGDACFAQGVQGQCPLGCAATVTTFVSSLGCCGPLVNRYLQIQAPSYDPASNLPYFTSSFFPSGVQTMTGFNGYS